MIEQLKDLLDFRSSSETTLLHDRLRDIRSNMNANGVFNSSMHVNAAIRACSDYIEQYGSSSLEDYKRAISAAGQKYNSDYLSSALDFFLLRLSEEKIKTQEIIKSSVGGIASSLSNKGLQDYQAYEVAWSNVFRKAKAEAEIFNALLLEKKPSLLSLLKDKWHSNPAFVVIVTVGAAILFLSGLLESLKKIAGTLAAWLG